MTVSIRPATLDDAKAIARVDLETHIEAYRPLLGESYLADASLEVAVARWRDIINGGDPSQPPAEVLVAQRDDDIVAYSTFGPYRDDDADSLGEVYTLYVHPSAWRSGVGGALLRAASARLKELGHVPVVLWVLEVNDRARAFYEAQGWGADGATEASRYEPHRNLRYRAARPSQPDTQ